MWGLRPFLGFKREANGLLAATVVVRFAAGSSRKSDYIVLPAREGLGKSARDLSFTYECADGIEVMTRILQIFSFRALALGFVALLAASCGSLDYTADFATNELLFADVQFRTKAPGDRQVFVTPLKDERGGTVLPLHERGFPIRYGNDDFWERPVTEMLVEVLERHLINSELFPAVKSQAGPEDLILKPTLVMFTVGSKEAIAGSATFAEVGLRVEVLGPADEKGERPLWHDCAYGNRQMSEFAVKPISPYRLIGRALQLTISNTLSGLDSSNVGRSHVPVEIVVIDPSQVRPKAKAIEASGLKR